MKTDVKGVRAWAGLGFWVQDDIKGVRVKTDVEGLKVKTGITDVKIKTGIKGFRDWG